MRIDKPGMHLTNIAAVDGSMMLASAVILAHLAATGFAYQSPVEPAEARMRFEVASVRPAVDPPLTGDCGGGPGTGVPGRLMCNGAPLRTLIKFAYDVNYDQISGPRWIEEARYTIVATVPAGATREQARKMLQNLLVDRFGLVLHREEREFPAFELGIAKNGPKLKDAEDPNALPYGPGFRFGQDRDGFPEIPIGTRGIAGVQGSGVTRLTARSTSISELIARLAPSLGTLTGLYTYAPGRILDHTSLSGRYDFTLEFAGHLGPAGASPRVVQTLSEPNTVLAASIPSAAPPLAEALEQQLGLKLTKTKTRAEILVIDRAEKFPTEN